MSIYHVSCINKPNRYDSHSRILGIGGVGFLGVGWYKQTEDVIKCIQNGDVFIVSIVGVPQSHVIIGRGPTGIPDLTTSADGIRPNNLLSLPDCPL